MKYTLFRNTYFKPLDNQTTAIYHPFTNHLIAFIPKEIGKTLLSFKEPREANGNLNGYKDFLIKHKVIVPEDYDQKTPINNLKKLTSQKPDIGLMYLVITEECNLRCQYCFIEGNINHKPAFMPQEICDKAIDYFTKVVNKDNEQKVRFYGGEPFLNFSLFRHAVKELRDLERNGKLKNLEIAVASNGTGINQTIAKFCKDYNINVAVSIDGPEEIHDSTRKRINGMGSYKDAVRGFNLLKQQGLNPAVSCTITKYNVDCLDDVVNFFIHELNVQGFGFNYLLDFQNIENPASTSTEKASKALLKAFEILREKGFYEDRIMRRLSKIIENTFHVKDCAGYGHQIVVDPHGNVGPCEVFLSINKYVAGNIQNISTNISNNPVFQEFNNRNPLNMEQCHDCSYISLCGGGCAFEAYAKKGSIWEKDERACGQCKELVDWVINDIHKKRANK